MVEEGRKRKDGRTEIIRIGVQNSHHVTVSRRINNGTFSISVLLPMNPTQTFLLNTVMDGVAAEQGWQGEEEEGGRKDK